MAPTGPSNSNATSYPGNGSSGCLSQLTPWEEQTATDAVAEVEGIDFSHGPVLVAGQCLLSEPRDTISASSDLGIFIQSFASNLDVGGTLDQFGRKLAYDFVQNHKGEGQLYGLLVDQASGYAAGYDSASANGILAGALQFGAMLAPGGAARGGTTVIGKLGDLKNIAAGERTLLDRLPNLGSPKANWYQNSGVLRQEMSFGNPIRDATVDASGRLINNTGFLRAERNMLETRGWTFDSGTTLWMPPLR